MQLGWWGITLARRLPVDWPLKKLEGPFPTLLVGLLMGGSLFFVLPSPRARSAIATEADQRDATCLIQQSPWVSFRDVGNRTPHASA